MTDSNYEKYEAMLKDLSDESGRAAWSSGTATIFYVTLLIIIATIIARLLFPFANMLVMLLIFAAEGIALFIPVLLYYRRAGVYMEERCFELDATHPGIYDAYEEWRRREAEKSVSAG